MANLNLTQLELLWEGAGGPRGAEATAAAIALAESGGDPSKIDNTEYAARPGFHEPVAGAEPEYSVGLWQINLLAHPEYTEAEMLDPAQNAAAAVKISGNGGSFSQWTTYTNGAYRTYLGQPQPHVPPPPRVSPAVAGAGVQFGAAGGGVFDPGTDAYTAPDDIFKSWVGVAAALSWGIPHHTNRAIAASRRFTQALR